MPEKKELQGRFAHRSTLRCQPPTQARPLSNTFRDGPGATHVTQRGKGPKLLPTRRIYRTATARSSLGIVTGVLLPLSQPKVNDPLLSPVPGSSCGLTRTQMSTCRGSVKAGTKQGDRRKK